MVLEAGGVAKSGCPHPPLRLATPYCAPPATASSRPRQQPTHYTSALPRRRNVCPHRPHRRLSDPGRGSRMPSLASSYARTSRSSLSFRLGSTKRTHLGPEAPDGRCSECCGGVRRAAILAFCTSIRDCMLLSRSNCSSVEMADRLQHFIFIITGATLSIGYCVKT